MTQPYPQTPNDPEQPLPPAVHEPKTQPIHQPIPDEPIHPELPRTPPPAPEIVIEPLRHRG